MDVDFVLLHLEKLVVVFLGGRLIELNLGLFCGGLLWLWDMGLSVLLLGWGQRRGYLLCLRED